MHPSTRAILALFATATALSACTHFSTTPLSGTGGSGGSSSTMAGTNAAATAAAGTTSSGGNATRGSGSGGPLGTGSSAGASGGGASGGGSGGNGGGAPAKPLYIVSIDHKASPSVLLKVNVETGVGTVACTLPDSVDAVNYHSSTFSRDGTLFASNANDARIDKIDPCSCAVTPLGPTGFGSIPGITANKANGLYGIEVTDDILLDINPVTGAAMQVGNLGGNFTTSGATWSDALYGGQGGLYAINGLTNQLYTIDPLTGTAKVVADIAGVAFTSVGIEMHPANGVIYGCTADAVLYSIDSVTGQATKIGNGMGHVSSCNNLAAPWVEVACLDAL